MHKNLLFIVFVLFMAGIGQVKAWRRRRRSCDSSPCQWQWGSCSKSCGGGTQSPQVTKPQGSCGSCSLPASKSCNTQCCPVNCAWGSWGSWGSCSATCGSGTRTRYRSYSQTASCGGYGCSGSSSETSSCNDRCCSVDCEWGKWGQWGNCSASCGDGIMTRNRIVTTPESCGGSPCSGSANATAHCNDGCCKTDCVWGQWSEYSECSTTCGCGNQTRNRAITVESCAGGEECFGSSSETRTCNEKPVDCKWGPWSEYGDCSATCGDGLQTRRREVAIRSICGGAGCKGLAEEFIPCNLNCCPVDCVWDTWSEFGPCSVSCGNGTKTRTRNVEIGSRGGGTSCTGPVIDTRTCSAEPCQNDCVWTVWSNWTECSAGCGGGHQHRTRAVSSQNGETDCSKFTNETKACNDDCCVVDCDWENWSNWTFCTQTCGGGVQKRQRTYATAPSCGGAHCQGDFTEERVCNDVCCPEDCIWSEWTLWETCSKTCGTGWQSRYRNVTQERSCGGVSCLGDSSESRTCNEQCCSAHCEMSPWENWSICTTTCGPSGVSQRTRFVISYPACDGSPCAEETEQIRECNRICLNSGDLANSTCQCRDGWTGDCCDLDIDECETSQYLCHEYASCFNTIGSYTCHCKSGFNGDGYEQCEDINECLSVDHGCVGESMLCSNSIGTYSCECEEPLKLVDGRCEEPYDTCQMSPWEPWSTCSAICGANGVTVRHRTSLVFTQCGKALCGNETTSQSQSCNVECFNGGSVIGSECVCPPGWTGPCCDEDMNECENMEGSATPCDVNAGCINTTGSYTCQCKSGYTGDGHNSCHKI